MTEKIKIYCIFAGESVAKMNGNRGKLTAQAGHAFLHSFWDAEKRFPEMAQAYRNSSHAYKIGLLVPTVAELETLRDAQSMMMKAVAKGLLHRNSASRRIAGLSRLMTKAAAPKS